MTKAERNAKIVEMSKLDKNQTEIANELGVNFGRKATAEENGAVGGEITKRLIAQAKQSLIK